MWYQSRSLKGNVKEILKLFLSLRLYCSHVPFFYMIGSQNPRRLGVCRPDAILQNKLDNRKKLRQEKGT